MVRGMEAMTEGYLNGPVGAAFPEDQLWMRFLDSGAPENLLAVWTVRVFMLVILISAVKKRGGRELDVFRTASAIAVAGMICTVTLGSQTVIGIPEDELAMWNLLSVILMFSVLVYNLNRHYEAEKEIVRLKEEQAELLDREIGRAYV